MRNISIFALFAFLISPVRAQLPSQDSIPVPMNAQERQAVAAMCDAAAWASKRQFEGMCDYFKQKFDAADAKAKADAEKAKPAEPEKKD